jgi:hypothetical protein
MREELAGLAIGAVSPGGAADGKLAFSAGGADGGGKKGPGLCSGRARGAGRSARGVAKLAGFTGLGHRSENKNMQQRRQSTGPRHATASRHRLQAHEQKLAQQAANKRRGARLITAHVVPDNEYPGAQMVQSDGVAAAPGAEYLLV